MARAAGRWSRVPARRDPRDPDAIVAALPRAAAGPLLVDWRVLSQDGHPSGDGDDGPLAVTARLLLLIAPIGMLGLVVLAAGVVAPAVRAGGVAPPGRPPGEAEGFRERAEEALARRARAWWAAWWALVAAGAAGLVLLPVALLRALGEGAGDLGTLLLDTRAGTAWWVQAGALAAAAVAGWRFAAGGCRRAPGRRSPSACRRPQLSPRSAGPAMPRAAATGRRTRSSTPSTTGRRRPGWAA